MDRTSRILVLIIVITLTTGVLLTCSSDNPSQSHNNPGGTIDTIVVALVDPSPSSLSWVKLSGLPTDNDELYGMVFPALSPISSKYAGSMVAADSTDTAFTFIVQTDSGTYMMTPLNPSDPAGGGNIEIVITDDGSIVSEPIQLTLAALPEAPGEFDAIVTLMQQSLDQKLRLAGTTREALADAAPGNIPLTYLSLYVAYDALDNPDNPNSLRAIVDGNAPLTDSATIDWELVDRAMALTGYRDYLTDFVGGLDSLETPPSLGKPITLAEAAAMAASPDACFDGPDLGINDCASLARAMKTHTSLARAARSAAEKVKADIASNTLLLVGMLPGGAAASAAIGAGLFIDAKIAEGKTAMYPSYFIDAATSFNPSKIEFEEDFTESGNWTEFNVAAASQGWKLDKLVLESIMQALSAKGGYDSYNQTPPGLDEFIDGLDQTVKETAIGPGTDLVIQEFAGESDILEICPNTWTNINCLDQNYSDAVVSSGPLTVDEPNHTFEPTDLGNSVLRVETNDSFGEEQTGIAASITTNSIQVFIDPFQAEADTAQQLTFHVRVENAADKRVNFTLEGGGSLVAANNEMATIKTPGSPWNPPLELVATSLSETGLRANATEEREDRAPITYRGGGIATLSPPYDCLMPGEDREFTVNYTGGTINTVEWSIEPPGVGSLNESFTSATYTAPNESGTQVTITATVNDSSAATAHVDINACRCNWTFEGAGSGYAYSASGSWGDGSTLGALYCTLKETEESFLPLIGVLVYNAADTGSYQTENISFTGVDEISWAYSDLSQPLPTVEIQELVPGDYFAGIAYGTLSHRTSLNPPEYDYITFTLSFRAEFFNLERPQCSDSTGM